MNRGGELFATASLAELGTFTFESNRTYRTAVPWTLLSIHCVQVSRIVVTFFEQVAASMASLANITTLSTLRAAAGWQMADLFPVDLVSQSVTIS